jgi:hypothetical protein
MRIEPQVSPGPAAAHATGVAPAIPALIDARGTEPWQIVGGLTLVARLVRSLELEGVHDIRIVCDGPVPPAALGSRLPQTRVRSLVVGAGEPLERALPDSPVESLVLAVDGTLVVDRRLLRALARGASPCVVRGVPSPVGPDARVRLGLLDRRHARLLGAPGATAAALPGLAPSSLPTFSAEMRGETPILLHDASTPAAARAAEQALVRATQKHVMDAPARWIDPPIEFAIVTRLAPTGVTPDHVTLACTALGFVAALCLWRGWLGCALPLMYVVGWLDGVDGKLARLRLEFSRLGAQEAYLDYAYENAWWVALATHFASAGHGAAAIGWGTALVGGNLLDEISYRIADTRLGTNLDLLSPADGAFRLIAGRRNIYAAMLLVATLCGAPYTGLVAMGAWAVTTGLVHALRVAVALRADPRPGLRT